MIPVVVIATHERIAITKTNVDLLSQQSFKPEIVIVVSDPAEAKHFEHATHIIHAANHPLGRKWQAGINYARTLSASHVIVTGSDDILCTNFIRRFCGLAPFVGLQKWFVLNGGVLYLFDYLAKQCLGGGRIYSKALLDTCNWQIFDTGASKLLDDFGYKVQTSRSIVTDEACILAVKGPWKTMNPFHAHLNSPNVKFIRQYNGSEAKEILVNQFNYEM